MRNLFNKLFTEIRAEDEMLLTSSCLVCRRFLKLNDRVVIVKKKSKVKKGFITRAVHVHCWDKAELGKRKDIPIEENILKELILERYD